MNQIENSVPILDDEIRLIEQNFIAQPVGAGFFYAGQIKSGEEDFNFIVDCGSFSTDILAKSVNLYRENKQKDIDLLILTCFDQNHINGLLSLVSNKKIKRIIVPYTSFSERLTLALNYLSCQNSRYNSIENTLSIELILDFTKALTENIDSDTAIYFLKHTQNEINFHEACHLYDELLLEVKQIDFKWDNTKALSPNLQKSMKHENLFLAKEVDCTQPGFITVNGIPVLEFVFYHPEVDAISNSYFKNVYNLFHTKYLSDKEGESIENVLRTINQLTLKEINHLLTEAKIESQKINPQIQNASFFPTSIALLHQDSFYFTQYRLEYKLLKDENINCKIEWDGFSFLGKIVGNNMYFTKFRGYFQPDGQGRFYNADFYSSNTILASSLDLKGKIKADSFLNYFRAFLSKTHYLQIPGNGKVLFADRYLFNQLKKVPYFFINCDSESMFEEDKKSDLSESLSFSTISDDSRKIIPVSSDSFHAVSTIVVKFK